MAFFLFCCVKLFSLSIHKTYHFLINFISFFFFVALFGCDQSAKGDAADNDMYDFNKPKIVELNTDLDEISGIAYYEKDTSVFAIVDEVGLLYKISLKEPGKEQHWDFGKNKDFEDVVLRDSTFYVLQSNGNIVRVNFEDGKPRSDKYEFLTSSKKKNEFETLFIDEDNRLRLICKDCEDDDKETLSTFYFTDTSNEHYSDGPKLDMTSFVQKYGVKKHLKPSAAAINPVTKEFFLLSSVLKVLLVYSPNGELKEMIKLDPTIYKQPEGLAFTPEGNLIISNEYAQEGLPNLLLIKNKKL